MCRPSSAGCGSGGRSGSGSGSATRRPGEGDRRRLHGESGGDEERAGLGLDSAASGLGISAQAMGGSGAAAEKEKEEEGSVRAGAEHAVGRSDRRQGGVKKPCGQEKLGERDWREESSRTAASRRRRGPEPGARPPEGGDARGEARAEHTVGRGDRRRGGIKKSIAPRSLAVRRNWEKRDWRGENIRRAEQRPKADGVRAEER